MINVSGGNSRGRGSYAITKPEVEIGSGFSGLGQAGFELNDFKTFCLQSGQMFANSGNEPFPSIKVQFFHSDQTDGTMKVPAV